LEGRRGVPIRTCAGCGAKRAKWELLRMARLPDGRVKFDPDQRLGGRGVYLCPDEGCVRRALRRGRLSKALGVRVPDELVRILEEAAQIWRSMEGVKFRGEG